MSTVDWHWKLEEAAERIRTRYEFIGRKTGAPFLALVHLHEVEPVVLREWHSLTDALRPDFDVRHVDVLEVTQRLVQAIGADEIDTSLADPMPGSDPLAELGSAWVEALADEVRSRLSEPGTGLPVVSLQRMAALWPAAAPRDLMQTLWDSAQASLDGPVVVLVPGALLGTRTYSFLGVKTEFMYRGDLL